MVNEQKVNLDELQMIVIENSLSRRQQERPEGVNSTAEDAVRGISEGEKPKTHSSKNGKHAHGDFPILLLQVHPVIQQFLHEYADIVENILLPSR